MTHKSQIHYLPDKCQIEVTGSQSILEASLAAGVPFAHACGGQARCSTCRVMVIEGLEHCSARSPEEEKLSRHLGFGCSVRLACQTRVNGDIRLRRLILDWEDETLAMECIQSAADTSPGEEKTIAILFADIAGFTAFSEPLPPYDVIHTLSRYYHHIGEIITRNHGSINNYSGDGFMALFGVDDPEEAACNAVTSGLEILDAVERLKSYFQRVYGKSFSVRIGVHYGNVVIGSIGSHNNQQTTVIGDTVNFASRIEAANKKTDTCFLISKEVYQQIAHRFETRLMPPQKIPGKSGKHELFEVVRPRI